MRCLGLIPPFELCRFLALGVERIRCCTFVSILASFSHQLSHRKNRRSYKSTPLPFASCSSLPRIDLEVHLHRVASEYLHTQVCRVSLVGQHHVPGGKRVL